MTHDELLEKVNEELSFWKSFKEEGNIPMIKALRAVMKLHKPINGNDKNICLACSVGFSIAYPCETIQAIEEQLK